VEPEAAAGQAKSAPGSSLGADFEAFWFEHYRYYCWVLMAIGATLEDAHDTIGDLIEDMHKKHTWGRLSNPKAWFHKALLHTYYNRRKRQRRRLELEIKNHLTPESYIDDRPNVWEDWQWVAQMLSTLPPTQRSVVELIIAEMDAREIADLLGKTSDTIRQNLAQARKKLRANLGPDYQIGPATCPAPVPRQEDTP
jgi:RNA polymerase sigma factor (sigma-70 family)